jgi:hypothetical protein
MAMKLDVAILFLLVLSASVIYGQNTFPLFPLFDCPSLPPPPPVNDVNKLRPGNIKAVMAVGDSISAGFAMRAGRFWDILDLVEFRGDVFSAGGNPGSITVPNFLKKYNPNIVGMSVGYTWPLDVIRWKNHLIDPWNPNVTYLNGAQSMARIQDVPAQVDYITQLLNTTYSGIVDMKNDWKLMTIFIGANNICPSCRGGGDTTPDFYEQMLRLILNKIYNQIPRTFVNIVMMFNISQVYDIAMTSDYCIFMWETFCRGECPCMTEPSSTRNDRHIMDLHSQWYNERILKVVKFWQDKNLKDFKVVAQPFLTNLSIPKTLGLNFLSKFDCFHPNAVADAAFAIGLWNNMFQPPGQKQTSLNVFNMTIVCPDVNSVLQ